MGLDPDPESDPDLNPKSDLNPELDPKSGSVARGTDPQIRSVPKCYGSATLLKILHRSESYPQNFFV
jgi:hypothetical protein